MTKNDLKIRQATAFDLTSIEDLNNRYFHEVRDFKKLLESNEDEMVVAVLGSKIVGFSGIHINKWNNSARVIDIFVHPKQRGIGIGSKLVNEVIKLGKKQKVRTVIAEAPSLNSVLSLYLKNGFRLCGYNDRYYANDGKESAIFLSYDFK